MKLNRLATMAKYNILKYTKTYIDGPNKGHQNFYCNANATDLMCELALQAATDQTPFEHSNGSHFTISAVSVVSRG